MKTLNRILLGLLLVLLGAAIAVIVMYTTIWQGYTSALERVTDNPVAAKTAELGQYIDHYFVGAYDGTELADAAAAAMV